MVTCTPRRWGVLKPSLPRMRLQWKKCWWRNRLIMLEDPHSIALWCPLLVSTAIPNNMSCQSRGTRENCRASSRPCGGEGRDSDTTKIIQGNSCHQIMMGKIHLVCNRYNANNKWLCLPFFSCRSNCSFFCPGCCTTLPSCPKKMVFFLTLKESMVSPVFRRLTI